MVKMTFRITCLLLLGRKCITSLSLVLFAAASVQASEAPVVSGLAKERWYIQGVVDDRSADTRGWRYATYLDLGYNVNPNDPGIGLWRNKSTTFKVNDPQVNMAMGYIRKDASPQSRWGMEFGLQTGVDTESLVPVTPPVFNEPIPNADSLRHLYRANGTYLFPVGKGLEVTAGLINSYIGYESYFAIQNLNYTRGYLLDFVPYFLIGAQGAYPVTNTMDLSLFIVGGWNYLAHPNNAPSYGLQAAWQLTPRIRFTQNLYYGPDQEDTGVGFWRFFSDSIIEWKSDQFLLAAAFDVGTEKQADVVGNPRYNWMAAAVYAGWHIAGPWSLSMRPELYWDPDGLSTGADQLIRAITTTLEYTFSPFASNTIVAALEYRYDRSTGPDGGFFEGDDNRLVPDQHQVIISFMWTFGS
jgi:hypothetical protein